MRRTTRIARTVAAVVLALALVLALVGCGSPSSTQTTEPANSEAQTELSVSAAATLKAAFEDMAPEFEKANDAKLVFNFGASGVLQKQVESGAPVDVFASASPKQVDALIEGGYISADATATFASNDLVIIVPKGNPKGITGPADLAKAEKLTTGNPETAPHGTKAKEWLEGQGKWSALQSRFVFAENAAQTFDYVARGEVDAGLVFVSETNGKTDVEVVYTVPAVEIKPVKYVIAPIKESTHADLAQKFIDYVLSPEGQKILAENGFKPAPDER